MTALNIIRNSPTVTPELTQALKLASGDDIFVLIDDGVYCLCHQPSLQLLSGVKTYAIREHVTARGLNIIDNIELIPMTTLVQLTLINSPIITWQ